MRYRRLGRAGPPVPVLSLGSWQTYERLPFEECVAIVEQAMAAGATFFDCARYDYREHIPLPVGSPHTESIFGRVVAATGRRRSSYVLSEKVWYDTYPAEPLGVQVDRSLDKLGTDYVDVLYAEPPAAHVDFERLIDDMAELVESGRTRYWGVQNCPASLLEQAHRRCVDHGVPAPAMVQLKYSVARRALVESPEVERLFRDLGIGLHAADTLEGGILAGRPRSARSAGTRAGSGTGSSPRCRSSRRWRGGSAPPRRRSRSPHACATST